MHEYFGLSCLERWVMSNLQAVAFLLARSNLEIVTQVTVNEGVLTRLIILLVVRLRKFRPFLAPPRLLHVQEWIPTGRIAWPAPPPGIITLVGPPLVVTVVVPDSSLVRKLEAVSMSSGRLRLKLMVSPSVWTSDPILKQKFLQVPFDIENKYTYSWHFPILSTCLWFSVMS